MTGPIYHLFIVRGFREAYYQLSTEERDQVLARAGENDRAVGAKFIVTCDSRWCNERYAAWGVEEFPDLQSVQKSTRANEENQHFRYIEAETYLGTQIENMQFTQMDIPSPLYQLFLIKNQDNDRWESLSPDTRNRISSGVLESIQKHGGRVIIGCDVNWSNEEYSNFGVTAWPSVEAEQAHFKDLENLGWHRYFYGKTILGVKLE